VPYCPKCGILVDEGATICSNCGYVLEPQKETVHPSPQFTSPSSAPPYLPLRDMGKEYANFGLISAVLSLFIVPEIFGSAAIILGAYAWKRELGNSNRGLSVLVLGIICMLIGIYFTSLFELGDLIPAF